MSEDFDGLLDRALRTYVEEPRMGIEARVRTRLSMAPRRRTFAWLPYGFAASALAALIAGYVFFPARREMPPRRVAVERKKVEPAPTVIAVAQGVPARRVRRVSQPANAAAFPIPSPLTAEERALLDLAGHAPGELQMLAESSSPGIEPLRIETIKIEPLETSETGEEK